MKPLLMIIGTLSLLLCGCRSMENEKSVSIGVIMPQSGEFASYGTQLISGMEYFVRQFNAENSVKIKLLIKDNQSTPDGSVIAFNQLVRENVPLIIGAYSSNNTAVLKPFAQRNKIPVISPTATSDVVTANNPYMFRTCFSNSAQGVALGNFVAKRMEFKRIGILINIDEDGEYSKGLSRAFAAAYRKAGGVVAIEKGYSRTASSDFDLLIKQVLRANVDAIFAPTYLEEATEIIKAARKRGFTGNIFGGDGWDEAELLTSSGKHVNLCFFSTMFCKTYQFPAVKAFVTGYKRDNNGSVPGLCAAQGYDTIAIVAKIISDGDLKSLDARLSKVKDFPGVTGKITITPAGNAIKTVFVKRVRKLQNGHFEFELIGAIAPE